MGYFLGSKCKWCRQRPVRFGSPYCSNKCQSEAEGKSGSSSGGSGDSGGSGGTGDLLYFLIFGWWIALGKMMFWFMKKTTEMAIKFYKWNPKIAITTAIVFSVFTLINNACEKNKKEEIENNVKTSFIEDGSLQARFVKMYIEYYEDFEKQSDANKLANYLTKVEPILKELIKGKEKLVLLVKAVETSSDNKNVSLIARIPETDLYFTNKKSIFDTEDNGIKEGDPRFIEVLNLKKDDIIEVYLKNPKIDTEKIKTGIINKSNEIMIFVNYDKIKLLNVTSPKPEG